VLESLVSRQNEFARLVGDDDDSVAVPVGGVTKALLLSGDVVDVMTKIVSMYSLSSSEQAAMGAPTGLLLDRVLHNVSDRTDHRSVDVCCCVRGVGAFRCASRHRWGVCRARRLHCQVRPLLFKPTFESPAASFARFFPFRPEVASGEALGLSADGASVMQAQIATVRRALSSVLDSQLDDVRGGDARCRVCFFSDA
jgi:hypothetical protein